MDNITCEIINDLLPLYCDDVCSPDSRSLVEDHLKSCTQCRGILEKMQSENFLSRDGEPHKDQIIKDMAAVWKKSVFRSFLKGLLTAFCVCQLLFAGYWLLTRWPLTVISPDDIQADAIVTGSRYTVHIKTTDGYKSTSADMKTAEDGKLYIMLKRGMIPIKNGDGAVSAETFSGSVTGHPESGKTVKIKEIYYGTQDDHILLWKESY